jgi:hypothetical protein
MKKLLLLMLIIGSLTALAQDADYGESDGEEICGAVVNTSTETDLQGSDGNGNTNVAPATANEAN